MLPRQAILQNGISCDTLVLAILFPAFCQSSNEFLQYYLMNFFSIIKSFLSILSNVFLWYHQIYFFSINQVMFPVSSNIFLVRQLQWSQFYSVGLGTLSPLSPQESGAMLILPRWITIVVYPFSFCLSQCHILIFLTFSIATLILPR